MDISHVPKELQNLPQWVCFRFEPDKKTEKLKKVPINPNSGYKASTVNPWNKLLPEKISSCSPASALFLPKNPALWGSTLTTALKT